MSLPPGGIRCHWVGRRVHTVCPEVARSRLTTHTPLWMFNMLWWDGVVCRRCVPEPTLSKAAADKVPWPWRRGESSDR